MLVAKGAGNIGAGGLRGGNIGAGGLRGLGILVPVG